MDKNYFQEICEKYDFITALYVTDNDGVVLVSIITSIRGHIGGTNEEFEKKMSSLKTSLAFIYNSQIEQIARIEKWKTQYITTIYDSLAVFQTKLNKNLICHFICETGKFNSSVLKDICSDLKNKFKTLEREIDLLNSNTEINI
jgi:hypothetical protein